MNDPLESNFYDFLKSNNEFCCRIQAFLAMDTEDDGKWATFAILDGTMVTFKVGGGFPSQIKELLADGNITKLQFRIHEDLLRYVM